MARSAVSGLAFAAVMALAASASAASIILPTGSSWKYTFTDPTADPRWHWRGAWSSGRAPFGNCDAQCIADNGFESDFTFATRWNAGTDMADDLWLRKTIDLKGYDLSSIAWGLGVDNGFKLYVNGHLVVSHNAEGFAYRWEYPLAGWNYPGGPTYLTPYLVDGDNVISLALEDHGGFTAFDMEIRGDRLPSTVPEPATLALFGLGALGAVRRWRPRQP